MKPSKLLPILLLITLIFLKSSESFHSNYAVDPVEETSILNEYGSELLGEIPLEQFIGDLELTRKDTPEEFTTQFRVPNPTNSTHSGFVATSGKPDAGNDVLLYEMEILEPFALGLIITKKDRIRKFGEKRIYVALRKKTDAKDIYYAVLAYFRYEAAELICKTTYLGEPLCLEWDTWEERGWNKQSYKYFGHVDCSTSIFSSCVFNPKVYGKLVQSHLNNTKGHLEITPNFNETRIERQRPKSKTHTTSHVRTTPISGKKADYTYSLFADLDINKTEGRYIRYAIKYMSVMSDPARVFASVLKHPDHPQGDESLKGKLFEWMFKMTENEESSGVAEFVKDEEGARDHYRADIKDTVGTRKLMKVNLNRTQFFYQNKFGALNEIRRAARKAKLHVNGTPVRDLNEILKSDMFRNAIKKIEGIPVALEKSEKYKEFKPADKLPQGMSPWSRSEIINKVEEELNQHDAPVSYKLGHALTHAVPPMTPEEKEVEKESNTTVNEAAIASKVVESILFSSSDIFLKPGWKMQSYANISTIECLRKVMDAVKANESLLTPSGISRLERHKLCEYFKTKEGFRPGILKWTDKLPFYGFGGCIVTKPQMNWTFSEIPDSRLVIDEAHRGLAHYSKILRTHCSPHGLRYLEEMVKEGFLEMASSIFRIPHSMMYKHKLTPVGNRMLCSALEFETFTETFQARLQRTWTGISNFTPQKMISRSIDFLIEMSISYITKARHFEQHFIKLARSYVLTLRTIMVRLLQDQEILYLWCPNPLRRMCAAELHQNYKDKFAVHSIILFIIHGLGPLEQNKHLDVMKEFQVFYKKNDHENRMQLEYYDL